MNCNSNFFSNANISFNDLLAKLKANNATVTEITLEKLTEEQLVLLTNALQANTQLKTLSIKACVGTKLAQYAARILRFNQTIQSINLEGNGLDEADVGFLCIALASNHTLKRLNLKNNKIGDNGLKLLSFMLEANQSIQYLNIDHNQIGDRGIQALCESLENNKTLNALDLGWNDMTTKGMIILQSLLQANDTITMLDFRLDDYEQDQVQLYLQNNPLKPLLENNKFMAEKRQLRG